MSGFLRLLFGLAVLPACWGVTRVFVVSLVDSVAGSSLAASCSLLGGMLVFVFCWFLLPHMVRTYVFGHELTHALWGLLFGAVPTRVKVSARGGSVSLSKTNVFIVLAPYFFPFYTFVVFLLALAVYAFIRPLPWVPLWLFLVGFTWAFHILFTLETLTQRQPDVTMYGRIFSWTFIYLANLVLVLVGLASVTPLTYAMLAGRFVEQVIAAYVATGRVFYDILSALCSLIS